MTEICFKEEVLDSVKEARQRFLQEFGSEEYVFATNYDVDWEFEFIADKDRKRVYAIPFLNECTFSFILNNMFEDIEGVSEIERGMRDNGECTVRLNENEYITLTLASLRELLKNWENTLPESTDVCLLKWIGETNAYKSDEVEASRRVLRSFREFVLNNTKTEKVYH